MEQKSNWMYAGVYVFSVAAGISLLMFMLRPFNDIRGIMKRESRAYLTMEAAGVSHDGPLLKIDVVVRNTGKTPALNVTSWINSVYREQINDPFWEKDTKELPWQDTAWASNDVGAGQYVTLTTWISMRELDQKGKELYVYGHLKFRDIYQRCQNMQFRLLGMINGDDSISLKPIRNSITDSDNGEPCDQGRAIGIPGQ